MDRELVVLAREGDHDAFARLVAASVGRLNAIARLILRDYGLAEDAVQDAFVDAWRSLPGLRDPDQFDAWMTRLLSLLPGRAPSGSSAGRAPAPGNDDPDIADHQAAFAVTDQLERAFRA